MQSLLLLLIRTFSLYLLTYTDYILCRYLSLVPVAAIVLLRCGPLVWNYCSFPITHSVCCSSNFYFAFVRLSGAVAWRHCFFAHKNCRNRCGDHKKPIGRNTFFGMHSFLHFPINVVFSSPSLLNMVKGCSKYCSISFAAW